MRLQLSHYWQKNKNPSVEPNQNTQISKYKRVLDICILVLFGLSFFSIPALSFISGLNIITWILTILLFLAIFLDLLIFGSFKFDIISFSFVLFSISAFISSLLNGMVNFTFTPIFLAVTSLIIYTFLLENKQLTFKMALAAYFGVILFLIVFIFRYRVEILSFDFDRLGSLFGDINDIAIFMSFGLAFSIYILLFIKKIIFKLLSIPGILLFGFCALTSGSKIVILIIVAITIFSVFALFGKKRWWLSLIVLAVVIICFLIFLNLPFMETMKKRILDFVSTLFGLNISGANSNEGSTIDRFEMIVIGFTMFLQKPIFGWGIWGFANFAGYNGGWSHNHISETLCNFGLIGSLFFHVGFLTYFINAIKKRKINKFSFLFVIFFISAMFSVALNSQKIYAYFVPLIFIESDCANVLQLKIHFKKNKRGIAHG